ncbi:MULTISPECIES: ankyrin repeat domain-containing protein [Paenibacillus]|uniref:Ankyrin repeat domain-containing protein n=1 Tax=Paenibacillus cucumis (ex Kampfer et al. 2016) TaxID=1776858 RepID=A0ABS7KES8_9BACL|nr:ankyrin repeat domain-containing protein [Paenibacillus cucumis (ex Kampfer et al. 2016)]MBY0202471.1 ankyrin repeat domain-containing protein [Paenibacillus cucumis (ex Kampfer et al. 2016)]MDP9701799.1 ankyrin repeat protein [Paenibacillus intestini]
MKDTDQNTKQLEPLEQLFEAAQQNNAEKVKSLLAVQPELANTENKDGLTPLGYAAHFGSTESVHALIEHGADVNAISHSLISFIPCNTALHAALAGERSVEVIKLLLEHGASTSTLDSDGQQALHTAAFHTDQTAIIDLLLEYGADVKASNTSGEIALDIAKQRGHTSVAARLEQAMAKLS